MSTYAANEFIVSSNNSMNDNTYNSQKATKTHRIKAILKPLLRMLRKSSTQKKRDASFDSDYHSQDHCVECSDNSANEDLETSIMDEINNCQPNSAIFVADEDGQWNLSPVTRGACVPVHFARTEAGTFFWTSMRPDCDVSPAFHCYTECQQAAQQQPMLTHDRWVQA